MKQNHLLTIPLRKWIKIKMGNHTYDANELLSPISHSQLNVQKSKTLINNNKKKISLLQMGISLLHSLALMRKEFDFRRKYESINNSHHENSLHMRNLLKIGVPDWRIVIVNPT